MTRNCGANAATVCSGVWLKTTRPAVSQVPRLKREHGRRRAGLAGRRARPPCPSPPPARTGSAPAPGARMPPVAVSRTSSASPVMSHLTHRNPRGSPVPPRPSAVAPRTARAGGGRVPAPARPAPPGPGARASGPTSQSTTSPASAAEHPPQRCGRRGVRRWRRCRCRPRGACGMVRRRPLLLTRVARSGSPAGSISAVGDTGLRVGLHAVVVPGDDRGPDHEPGARVRREREGRRDAQPDRHPLHKPTGSARLQPSPRQVNRPEQRPGQERVPRPQPHVGAERRPADPDGERDPAHARHDGDQSERKPVARRVVPWRNSSDDRGRAQRRSARTPPTRYPSMPMPRAIARHFARDHRHSERVAAGGRVVRRPLVADEVQADVAQRTAARPRAGRPVASRRPATTDHREVHEPAATGSTTGSPKPPVMREQQDSEHAGEDPGPERGFARRPQGHHDQTR